MRERIKKLADGIGPQELLAFGGLAMIGYGLYLVYPPAAWIVVGAALFYIGAR